MVISKLSAHGWMDSTPRNFGDGYLCLFVYVTCVRFVIPDEFAVQTVLVFQII